MAEVHDRMHLKTTHYAYAKHAEALGEYPAAISRLGRDGDVGLCTYRNVSSGCNFFLYGILILQHVCVVHYEVGSLVVRASSNQQL